ncbi:TadE/TadG family type IV pilus assembly protein [Zobellella maritima]|uniref:TadE/TadG family type IV pilus assembly protein n=1 Tax=Zobellella maritima TaxID=2059725 RepID=UPI0018E59C60|nr:TadE family protein [Zobellella maritima]
MSHPDSNKRKLNRRMCKQRGAASIEFAFMFVIMFLLFYGLVGYTVPLLLGAAYQQLSAEALHEAVRRPDIYMVTAENSASAANHTGVSRVIEESWLPEKWAKKCAGYTDSYLKVSGNEWSVCIRNDDPAAILPTFSVFGWQVPQLPDEIKGEARLRIR